MDHVHSRAIQEHICSSWEVDPFKTRTFLTKSRLVSLASVCRLELLLLALVQHLPTYLQVSNLRQGLVNIHLPVL